MERLVSREKIIKVYLLYLLFFLFFLWFPLKAEANHTEILKFEDMLLSSNDSESEVGLNSNTGHTPTESSIISDDLFVSDSISDPVQIDADIIEYNEQTGIATAKGNVKVKNKNMLLTSPYVEYESTNAILDAASDEKNRVTILTGKDYLEGDHLRYNLNTRQGVLTKASGKAEALFMSGESVYLMSADEAKSQGLISSKKGRYAKDENIAKWMNVSSTTCDFDAPHYRLETRRAVIIPNQKIVMKRPKFYMGKSKLFTYPFDLIIALKKREQSLMPFLLFDTYTGIGAGIRGNLDFDKYGEINIAAIGWSKGEWEAKVRYQKEIMDRLWIYAQSDRLYNRDEKVTLWRPQWGADYTTKSGWNAKLLFSQRELIETTMRPGVDQRFNVWKDPEIRLTSPWYGPGFSKLSFSAVHGRYQDNTYITNPWVKRYGLIVDMRGNPDVSWDNLKPYYGARYTYYDYDSGVRKQKITDAWAGIRWNIGSLKFVSQYAQRWVDGTSSLTWDRYAPRRDFYQYISIPLPIGKSWEKWDFSIAGTYSFETEEIAEVFYRLNYNKHCITWQFWVRDKVASNEKQMGLTFFINAFPEYKIGIGSDALGNRSTGF